jgi:hypothetical protein
MQRVIIIFAFLILLSQTAFYNPTLQGSGSPPRAGTDGSPNPYDYTPTPGATPAQIAIRQKFQDFKNTHGKYYQNTAEESYRLGLFTARSKQADDFNKGPDVGWKKGINKFSDLTDE